jgi:hypothetical protein
VARPLLDRALVALLGVLSASRRLLPDAGVRALLQVLGAVGATLAWPGSSVRRRSRRAAVPLPPWRWGWSLGGNLAALLGAGATLRTTGWPESPGGALVLAAHSGPWEAGAAELARRGLAPLVIAAPWPRLPRTEARVRALRAALGVSSLPRGRGAMEAATIHLRAGGWVVVLVDSLNPRRLGRRALPFVDDAVAAPDGLVAWAGRQGASLLVATADRDRFALRTLLPPTPPHRMARETVRELSDAIVGALRQQARRRPWEWGWVRALAGLVCALLLGCSTAEPLPPLPLEPDRWRADVDTLRWEGTIDGAAMTFSSDAARVRSQGPAWVGAFEQIELTWAGADADVLLRGASARGTFPTGPLTVRDATYSVDGVIGETPELRWLGGTRVECGGCPLEALAGELTKPAAVAPAP